MNPLSGIALQRSLDAARSADGLLWVKDREKRWGWRQAIAAQDPQKLLGLRSRSSVTEWWEMVAGCGSLWGWNEVLGWGRPPNIGAFDGFVDALNTADSPAHRDQLWGVWPALANLALERPEFFSYLLRSLCKVRVWAPKEDRLLGFVRLIPSQDWQTPHAMSLAGCSESGWVTPLQYAWLEDNPGFCRLLLDSGADAHALAPDSWWPQWSLGRCFQTGCAGDEPAQMARPEPGPLASLTSRSGTFAHRLSQPYWQELVEHQRQQDRRRLLDQRLPSASPVLARLRF